MAILDSDLLFGHPVYYPFYRSKLAIHLHCTAVYGLTDVMAE